MLVYFVSIRFAREDCGPRLAIGNQTVFESTVSCKQENLSKKNMKNQESNRNLDLCQGQLFTTLLNSNIMPSGLPCWSSSSILPYLSAESSALRCGWLCLAWNKDHQCLAGKVGQLWGGSEAHNHALPSTAFHFLYEAIMVLHCTHDSCHTLSELFAIAKHSTQCCDTWAIGGNFAAPVNIVWEGKDVRWWPWHCYTIIVVIKASLVAYDDAAILNLR